MYVYLRTWIGQDIDFSFLFFPIHVQSDRSNRAPTQAAGRGSEPETPTKTGKSAESSSTKKLSSASGRKPPKLGAKTPKKEDTPSAKPVEDKADEAKEQISLKDNDASEKVQQAGDTSVADTSELSEADPQPIADSDDEETVPGSKEAAKDEGMFILNLDADDQEFVQIHTDVCVRYR
jgi:hypothetical protein